MNSLERVKKQLEGPQDPLSYWKDGNDRHFTRVFRVDDICRLVALADAAAADFADDSDDVAGLTPRVSRAMDALRESDHA